LITKVSKEIISSDQLEKKSENSSGKVVRSSIRMASINSLKKASQETENPNATAEEPENLESESDDAHQYGTDKRKKSVKIRRTKSRTLNKIAPTGTDTN
jgi:hypothetical protein